MNYNLKTNCLKETKKEFSYLIRNVIDGDDEVETYSGSSNMVVPNLPPPSNFSPASNIGKISSWNKLVFITINYIISSYLFHCNSYQFVNNN